MIESDLKRAAAGRAKALPAAVTFVAEPSSVDKREMIDFEQPNVIDGLAGVLQEAQMTSFYCNSDGHIGPEGAQAG